MASIERNRLRFAVDSILSRNANLSDKLTSKPLFMWQAEDVQCEVGLFNDGTIASDISNFDYLVLEIKPSDDLDGDSLLTKYAPKDGVTPPEVEDDQVTLNQSVSLENWNDDSQQHATFRISKEDSNIALEGRVSRRLIVYVWGMTGDDPARRVAIGRAPLILLDSGWSDVGSVAIQSPGARMRGGKLQVLCLDDGLYYDFVIRLQSGVPTPSVEGSGEE